MRDDRRRAWHRFLLGVMVLAAFPLGARAGRGGDGRRGREIEHHSGGRGEPTRTPIQHLIVIVGENHTFDNVFATYTPSGDQSISNCPPSRMRSRRRTSRGSTTSAGGTAGSRRTRGAPSAIRSNSSAPSCKRLSERTSRTYRPSMRTIPLPTSGLHPIPASGLHPIAAAKRSV